MQARCLVASLLVLAACEYQTVVGVRDLDDDFSDDSSSDEPPDLPPFDLGIDECKLPPAVGCDDLDDDPLHAIGLDCIGGTPAAGGVNAHPDAWLVHDGSLGVYAPREGDKLLILSTGRAEQIPLTHSQLALLGCSDAQFCPDTDFGAGPGELPAPIIVDPVSPTDPAQTCLEEPSLIGQGDCSNSLYEQWSACEFGCSVWDYAELRIGLTVPESTYGLAFDFAFLSVEWPSFVGGGYNDMFVAWIESERWTGNISFDDDGNPITVNAGFLDYQASAELEGFAMQGHGGTRWLTTDMGLVPGESIELVLAVLDLSDGSYDSAVLLDRFRWTCSDAPSPLTQPQP